MRYAVCENCTFKLAGDHKEDYITVGAIHFCCIGCAEEFINDIERAIGKARMERMMKRLNRIDRLTQNEEGDL